jgi:hypothetical protein
MEQHLQSILSVAIKDHTGAILQLQATDMPVRIALRAQGNFNLIILHFNSHEKAFVYGIELSQAIVNSKLSPQSIGPLKVHI